MPDPIPPVLLPYINPGPRGSLALVTSVLDATSNWLLLRFVHAALITAQNARSFSQKENDLTRDAVMQSGVIYKVIFVSLIRGFEHWKEMGKKLVGALICDNAFSEGVVSTV